jgi:pimeloyl-ACP methyl ester carboxylesterase
MPAHEQSPANRTPTSYNTASVTSQDGTRVGYRQLGRGPGLILLHGGMMAAQGFMQLAAALAERFCLIVPDRRGRGSSGPWGDRYGIAREREDVEALIAQTGAPYVFGLSSGAIIALEAALALPEIRRVAAYEPPYSTGRDNAAWSLRFDREVAAGQLGAAMLTVMKGTGAAT